MSEHPQGPGWWQASDGRWYPPESHPSAAPQPPSFTYGAPVGAVPPAAPKKSRAGLFIGLALVFGLGVVGCIALVATATDDAVDRLRENHAKVADGATQPADASDSASPSGGSAPAGTKGAPLPLGSEVDLGNGWKVRVNTADLGPTADAAVRAVEFNDAPDAGTRYIVVNLTVTFAGPGKEATQAPIFATDFSVFGSENREHRTSDTFATPPDPALDEMAELAVGGVTSGNLVFTVGADETQLVLRIQPGLSFDSTEAWVALG